MAVNNMITRVLRRNLKQALKRRNLRESEDLIRQLKREDPLSLESRGLELEFLIAREQWQEAQIIANQLLHLFPDSARIHFLSGRMAYKRKEYTDALHLFEESNRLYPHWITRRWIGKTHTQKGEYDAAESILLSVLTNSSVVHMDLAWLYERTDQLTLAIKQVENYIKDHPNDSFAKNQETRLKAQMAEPDTLFNDVEVLLELDEEIPEAMLPAYLSHLLEIGQVKNARQFLLKYEKRLGTNTAISLAWVCYKLQAYDLAMNLFVIGFPYKNKDVKYLSALESSARHCDRVAELIPHYENAAEEERRLYGRIKRLKKSLE